MRLERFSAITVARLALLLSVSASVRADADATAPPTTLVHLSDALEVVSERVGPAVVQVLATGYTPGGGDSLTSLLSLERSSGAGVVIDADGHIVTNAHVVGAARRVDVVVPVRASGSSILRDRGVKVAATIVGIDLETDLALLKVDRNELSFLELADSDEVRPGQLVLAFGSPLGLTNSVSMGVVSATARQLRAEAPMIYIQTDASINPGNSGGPLVDVRGRVIGINTLIFSQSGGNEGIGFAAPSNIVRSVTTQLRQHGRVRRGAIGAHVQTIDTPMARALGLDRDHGVIVADVLPGGPASVTGLRVGDIILTLDRKPMENGRQFEVNLYQRRVGADVRIELLREGRRNVVSVPVVERPGDPLRLAELVSPERNVIPELRILVLDLDDRVRAMLPELRIDDGVVVAAEAYPGPSEVGFAAGDVIHAINRKHVADLASLRERLAAIEPGEPMAVQIERRGQLRFIIVDLH